MSLLGLLFASFVGACAGENLALPPERGNARGAMAATATPTASPTPCGSFRWPVKIAEDPAASSIATAPQPATIAQLQTYPAPSSLTDSTPRIRGVETTIFQLTNVTLAEVFKEHDQDYHLLVRDSQGRTLITEVPNPVCAPTSSLYRQLSAVRKLLDARYPSLASGATVTPDITITAQGAGFFDKPDITGGEAPNGIELHTLIALCFGVNCTLGAATSVPSPSPTASADTSPTPTVSGVVDYDTFFATHGGFQIKTSGGYVWVYTSKSTVWNGPPLALRETAIVVGTRVSYGVLATRVTIFTTTPAPSPTPTVSGVVDYDTFFASHGGFQIKASSGYVWIYTNSSTSWSGPPLALGETAIVVGTRESYGVIAAGVTLK